VVLITGGLGPTEDDVTRDAVADALGVAQAMDPGVLAWLEQRFAQFGRKMAENNRRQANILAGAEILANPNGTAPGQWIATGGGIVALLPGPPRELKPMFLDLCLPRFRALLPPMAIATRHYRVTGMGESDLDQLISPIYSAYTNPVTTILAKPGDLDVILRARCASADEAEELCQKLGAPIEAALGDRIYSNDGRPLEQVVGDALLARNQTVAVAESMTSGLLAGRLTDPPGSSGWFRGGFLVYSADLKRQLIGSFSEDPVSEEVALRLAAAAREKAGATWGVAVTGFAGPGGDRVGEVWLAIAGPDGTSSRHLKLLRERALVRSMAVQSALDWLRRRMLNC
jgi:nicotinamide-nucleotide amidase